MNTLTDKKQQFWLIAIVSAVAFLMAFDFSSLNDSLSHIAQYFGVKVGWVAWLPTIYLLVITSTLLGFGKLGDIIGYKKVFLSGLVVFCFGGIACAVAPNFIVLFLARAFQSLGQAMYSPICIALLSYYLPANKRGQGLGFYATANGLGMAGGSLLGGFIVHNFSWHGNFVLGVVFSVIVFFAGLFLLPSKQVKDPDTHFDLMGALLLFLGLFGFLYALNSGARAGWTDQLVLSGMFTALVAFALFIIHEKRSTCPLLNFKLLSNLNFTFASLATLTALAMHIGIGFIFPFYLHMLRQIPALHMGLILMIPSIMMMLIAPISGTLSDWLGSRKLCMAGMGIAAFSFIIFSFLNASSGFFPILLGLILLGTGMGLFIAPNNSLVMQNAPADKQGVASGVYKIALNAGSSLGIALYMLVMSYVVIFNIAEMNIMLSEAHQYPALMEAAFRGAFIFGIVLALTAMLFSFLAKDKAQA
ncbi:MAG: MFS transporter [Candidatus Saganbacteria bacterium]|nr:MFS transporter [Candidatus Saganbacteria bacterium]